MNDGDFSKEDFLEIYKIKYKLTVSAYKPAEQPQAFVLGGQPGAGKTGLQEIVADIAKRNGLDHGNSANKPDSIHAENSVPIHRPRRK